MEDLSDEIMEELKQKAIEKEPTIINEVSIEKPKKKRERSEAQKAAFEKARLKRAENLKLKKEQKVQQKLNAKEQKKLVKEKVEKELSKEPEPEPLVRQQAVPQPVPVGQVRGHQPMNPREQVVNNYYYYGMAPTPQPMQQPVYYEEEEPPKRTKPKVKKGRKPKARPPTPVSSESEEEQFSDYDEPDTYKELQKAPVEEEEQIVYQQPTKPKLKFRFA